MLVILAGVALVATVAVVVAVGTGPARRPQLTATPTAVPTPAPLTFVPLPSSPTASVVSPPTSPATPIVNCGGSGADLWASTSNGNLYLTTNGGVSWVQRTPPISLAPSTGTMGPMPRGLFDVGLAGTTVWLVAPTDNKELLFQSDNEGKSWSQPDLVPTTPVPTSAQSPIGADEVYVQLLSPEVGFIAVDHFFQALDADSSLDESTNGGASFTVTRLPAEGYGPVRFISATDGFIAGGPGTQHLYETADGGMTWEQLTVVPPVRGDYTVGFPLAVTSSGAVAPVTVMVTGRDELYAMRASPSGPGQLIGTPLTLGKSYDVSIALTSSSLLAVASGSQVYTSDDAGETWTAVESKGLPPGWGIAEVISTGHDTAVANVTYGNCPDKTNCEYGSALYATSDEGVTWTPVVL
jgi:photosystem II stability/assembly factor-like uncharacterized protein